MKTQPALILFSLLSVLLLAGCGSGSGSPDSVAQSDVTNSYSLSMPRTVALSIASDTYGLQEPTWLGATDDAIGLVLRAELISGEEEMWFGTNVFRVDCPAGVTPGTYDLGETDSPCSLTIANGQWSSNVRTIAGSLTIDAVGDWFSGSLEAVIADYDISTEQLHWFSAAFSAPVGHGEPLVAAQ